MQRLAKTDCVWMRGRRVLGARWCTERRVRGVVRRAVACGVGEPHGEVPGSGRGHAQGDRSGWRCGCRGAASAAVGGAELVGSAGDRRYLGGRVIPGSGER